MNCETSKKNSIYFKLLKLLVFAAVLSTAFYILLNKVGGYVIDVYLTDSEYMSKKNDDYAVKLQEYINKEKMTTKDSEKLTEWIIRQKLISLQVYKDNVLVYDSLYPDKMDIWEEDVEVRYYDWETYYTVLFADGQAEVSISGVYAYRFHNYAVIAELILSFLLFLCTVMLGIHRTIKYIRLLSKEIAILEGGNLDFQITAQGKDELAVLAKSLDDMRRSFREQVEQEAYLVQINQKMITEMSHDLRTPLTSVMIYADLLKAGKYENDEKMKEYIEKICSKTHHMKQLSDHLFEYALVSGGTDLEMQAESLKLVLYDLLSETCGYLEQRGYKVSSDLVWKERKIQVNSEFIARILDNITSNIIKYADLTEKVWVSMEYQNQYVVLSFKNMCCKRKKREESTNIGIQNIKNMMRQMSGICKVKKNGREFLIQLYFMEIRVG